MNPDYTARTVTLTSPWSGQPHTVPIVGFVNPQRLSQYVGDSYSGVVTLSSKLGS